MEIKLSELINKQIIFEEKPYTLLKTIYFKKNSANISDIQVINNKYIPSENIISIEDGSVLINNKELIKDATGINWLKLSVQSNTGKFLGKVEEIWISENELKITKFLATKSFFGLFRYSKRIFPISRVIEIKENTVIINDENNAKMDVNLAKNVSFS